ncbi:dehydrin DHN3-like [Phragmites australis]|uniref:dehydrin DHN3-like n=1 Tax=Phragmites australis TaxID=29695 RepID=UPI002D79D514|nr:dehydrin DHN3-like [Phragmites australis]
MEHQGQRGHAITGAGEYGNSVAGNGVDTTGMVAHGAVAGAAPGGQVQPAVEDHRSRGILQRSSSSTPPAAAPYDSLLRVVAQSFEDDDMGRWRKNVVPRKVTKEG